MGSHGFLLVSLHPKALPIDAFQGEEQETNSRWQPRLLLFMSLVLRKDSTDRNPELGLNPVPADLERGKKIQHAWPAKQRETGPRTQKTKNRKRWKQHTANNVIVGNSVLCSRICLWLLVFPPTCPAFCGSCYMYSTYLSTSATLISFFAPLQYWPRMLGIWPSRIFETSVRVWRVETYEAPSKFVVHSKYVRF